MTAAPVFPKSDVNRNHAECTPNMLPLALAATLPLR